MSEAEELVKATWIADEEDGPAVAILLDLPNGDQVWSGEVPRATFEEQSEEAQAELKNDFGYFVVHASEKDGTIILARAVDGYMAVELARAYADWIARQALSTRTGG